MIFMCLSKSFHFQKDKEPKEHPRLKDNFQLVFSPLCKCLVSLLGFFQIA